MLLHAAVHLNICNGMFNYLNVVVEQQCFICWYTTIRCYSRVVPALCDTRRERPPAVYGHVINVPTCFSVKLPVIGRHLPNADADSHLLVVRTCYNGQCKQMPRFRRSFQSKIAGAHHNLRSTVQSIFSVLSSGDHKQ